MEPLLSRPIRFLLAGIALGVVALLALRFRPAVSHEEPLAVRPTDHQTIQAAAVAPRSMPPEIAFLADSIEESERLINNVKLQYVVRTQEEQRFLWAVRDRWIRFDSTTGTEPPYMISRFVWDGKQGRVWDAQVKKDGAVVPLGIQMTSGSDELVRANQYKDLTRIRNGGMMLSEALRSRGINAKRQGRNWIVRLRSVDGKDPNGFEDALIRPDRGYRAEQWTKHDSSGNVTQRMTVKEWLSDKGGLWLPATVELWFGRAPNSPLTLQVTEATLGRKLPDSLFTLPDDGKTPIFDAVSQRFLREQAKRIVPITQARMEASFKALTDVLKKQPVRLTQPKMIHDNGARPEGECGLQCVWMIARLMGKTVSWEQLERAYPTKDGQHSMAELQDAAAAIGVSLEGLQVPLSQIARLKTPCIAHMQWQGKGHFCVLARVDSGEIVLFLPPSSVVRAPVNRFTSELWGPGYVLAPLAR